MRRSLVLAAAIAAIAVAACKKESPPPAPAGDASAAVTATMQKDGREIARVSCMSCHTEEMLAQQRLPKAKWEATVKKMAGWGANLDPGDEGALVAWLADTYGPDAGAYEPARIAATAAAAEIAPEDDASFANGDAAHGRTFFVDRCQPCHGADARGQIGVNLVERPVLYRARTFAETVRRGRGKMLPIAATDREIADVLAHLRTLRVP